jgi:flagellar biosynthesis/type III secretory pathway M-ring protein FliF/YscJ
MDKIAPDSQKSLSVEDVQNMLQQNILQLENKYKELIMTALSKVFGSDRYRDVLITTDLFNNAGHHGIRITVSVNIDGKWKIKYNEKGKPVLRSDVSIEREYIPISSQDKYNINLLIQHIIGYDKSRGDSITVNNIPFDRTNQFKLEDSMYFRQEKIKCISLLIIPFIIIILAAIIFKIKHNRTRNSV